MKLSAMHFGICLTLHRVSRRHKIRLLSWTEINLERKCTSVILKKDSVSSFLEVYGTFTEKDNRVPKM